MARQEGRTPTPEQACQALLMTEDGILHQCIRWPSAIDHYMLRNEEGVLRLPRPVHVSRRGHQWLPSGRVVFNPDEDPS